MLKNFPLYLTLFLFVALSQTSFAKPRPVPQPFTCEEWGWLAVELQSPDVDIRRDAINEVTFRAAYAAPLAPYVAALLGDTTYPTDDTPPGISAGINSTISSRASRALATIGYETIPALTEVVKSGTLVARTMAIATLGRINDYEVTTPLLIALDDENPDIRESAKNIFISPIRGRPQFQIKPLVEALKSPKPFVRATVMTVLGQTYTRDSEEMRLRSVAVLDLLNDPAPEVREEALKNLVYATSRKWPKANRLHEQIIKALDARDPLIRRAAVSSLADYGDMRAEPFLLRDLDSTDNNVRQSAIFNLAKLKSLKSVEPLIDMMLHSTNQENGSLKNNIAYALAEIGDQRAVEPLFKVVRNSEGKLNSEVVTAFEKLTGQSLRQHPLWKASLANKSD